MAVCLYPRAYPSCMTLKFTLWQRILQDEGFQNERNKYATMTITCYQDKRFGAEQ